MNIREAKEQIKNTVTAYLRKDGRGQYLMEAKRQRPVFLTGAPGIGKTAIMEQIAGELNIGLVSYSMIHHTRQSALGLPYIVEKTYGGNRVSVSEYTMSEIIAAVYDLMADTGVSEGILFLDEVNCVSETLAPAMLQFLQFKTFGRHALPEGWIVVTAGNPPEYNRAARRFDIVTLDRLKVMEVEPDLPAWKEYAYERGAHPAVTAYLDVRREDFCRVETTVDGVSFVTPRGWDDLSEMMKEYDLCGIPVDAALIGQYLRDRRVAKDFFAYYELYRKYEKDYSVAAIPAGTASAEMIAKAKEAGFDERLSLVSLVIAALHAETGAVADGETALLLRRDALRRIGAGRKEGKTTAALLTSEREAAAKRLRSAKAASSLTKRDRAALTEAAERWRDCLADETFAAAGDEEQFRRLRDGYEKDVAALTARVEQTRDSLDNAFSFMERAFGDGSEMLIFVTELTIHRDTVAFISRYGCDKYFEHDQKLLFYDRKTELREALAALEE